jgi:hypothetical protein
MIGLQTLPATRAGKAFHQCYPPHLASQDRECDRQSRRGSHRRPRDRRRGESSWAYGMDAARFLRRGIDSLVRVCVASPTGEAPRTATSICAGLAISQQPGKLQLRVDVTKSRLPSLLLSGIGDRSMRYNLPFPFYSFYHHKVIAFGNMMRKIFIVYPSVVTKVSDPFCLQAV